MADEKPKKVPTQEKILDAAKRLFLRQGFNGTSMSDIAKAAEVNQSLIHHHFDTKERLWGKIKDRLFDDYLASLEIESNSHVRPNNFAEFVQNMMQLRFNFLQENREVSRMLEWQSLLADSPDNEALSSGEQSNPRIRTLLQDLLSDFEDAAERASINPRHDSSVILMTILILTSGWFLGNNQWYLRQMLGDDVDMDEMSCKYLAFIKTLIVNGLQ